VERAKAKNSPDDLERAGDKASRKAVRIEFASLVAAFAFFLGVAARSIRQVRRSLLAAAVLVLVGAVAFEFVLEATL
jgi:hypothetical protein